MHPPRGVRLQLFHKIGKGQLCRKDEQEMNVVAKATNDQRPCAQPLDDTSEIGKQIGPQLTIEVRMPAFRAEQCVDATLVYVWLILCRP